MATTGTRQASDAAATAAALAKTAGVRSSEASAPASAPDTVRKPSGYGLPCAKCRLYYPADMSECPTCHHKERVSPVVPRIPARPPQAAPPPVHDSAAVEREREEFLRQFKSQLQEVHDEVMNATDPVCTLGGHEGSPANAEVCRPCHDRLQERLDVCEAALHLDLKEAAQIIYDAVWADPSDPTKTYQNAANALLAEIRKRAGVSLVNPFQPLQH
jgi:hypothetical protein